MNDSGSGGDEVAAMGMSPPANVAELRAFMERMSPLVNVDLPEVGGLHENVLIREVGGTPVTAEVIVPKGAGPHPVLVYLHGGGWVAGSPASHRKLAHRFAERGYLVVNADYRLAPEDRFPAAFDDAVEAVRWAARVADRWGGDPGRLAVGGDSAGGNLAAAACAALRDDPSAPDVKALLLLYAALDLSPMIDREVPGLSPEAARRMAEVMLGGYLGAERGAELLRDPRVSPIHVAERFPPTFLLCGGGDNLVEDAREAARRLSTTGVAFELRVAEGMPHGFVQMEAFPEALEAIAAMIAFLDRHVRSRGASSAPTGGDRIRSKEKP